MMQQCAASQINPAILSFIARYMATNGYSPTYREICKAVGIGSLSRVYIHLNELRDQGFIEFDYKKPRGISLPDRLIE